MLLCCPNMTLVVSAAKPTIFVIPQKLLQHPLPSVALIHKVSKKHSPYSYHTDALLPKAISRNISSFVNYQRKRCILKALNQCVMKVRPNCLCNNTFHFCTFASYVRAQFWKVTKMIHDMKG